MQQWLERRAVTPEGSVGMRDPAESKANEEARFPPLGKHPPGAQAIHYTISSLSSTNQKTPPQMQWRFYY